MIWLFRFLLGFVKFEYQLGFKESFINACYKNNLEIKNIKNTPNGISAICSPRVYKRLHTYAFKSGGRVRIIKKSGLPFILHPLKNRFGFFTGMVAFIFILSLMTGFIWDVEITGCNNLSEATLSTYLDNNGLKNGAMWSVIDKDKICAGIMRDFDEVAWVHINQYGAKAVVEIKESRPIPVGSDEKLKGIKVKNEKIEVVAYRRQYDMKIKSIKEYKRVRFYWLDVPLYFKMEQGDIEEYEEHMLKINGFTLPIGYTKMTEKRLKSSDKDLNDDELKALAYKKLELEEASQLDEYEIINKIVDEKIDNDKCIINASYIVKKKK